jgi:transcriptional regulator with XRE-family HTH domain
MALELGEELLEARLRAGLTLSQVAAAIGATRWQVRRHEQGKAPFANILDLSLHAAAVGLDLRVRAFAAASAIRDAGQVRVMDRFLGLIGSLWAVLLEAPVGMLGDQRAFDCVLRCAGLVIGVEVIVRLRDVQAQLRPLFAKARDAGIDRLIIVVADTRANREALELAGGVLGAGLSMDARATFAALSAGTLPPRDALVCV